MKKEIHPENYRPVIFADNSSGEKFLIASTIETKNTAKWTDGKEYPIHHVEISSASHPFYTNQESQNAFARYDFRDETKRRVAHPKKQR